MEYLLDTGRWNLQFCRGTPRYVQRALPGSKTLLLHRLVYSLRHSLPLSEVPSLDHCNRNGLDNRSENLRPCTVKQNQYNCGLRSDNTSGYKGVRIYKNCARPWTARIWTGEKRIYLGFFSSAVEAALAYNVAAAMYHGEFACFNQVDES